MSQQDEDFAPGDHLAPEERDLETPAEDAFEQAIMVDPYEEEPTVHRGLEVADWDALEQARLVGPNDDDYER